MEFIYRVSRINHRESWFTESIFFFGGGEGNPLDNEAAPPFFSTCPISVASGHRFQDYKVAFPLGGKPQAAPGQAPRKALL